MVPVVHLDITGWSQLSKYGKNCMVPVVHGTSCPTFCSQVSLHCSRGTYLSNTHVCMFQYFDRIVSPTNFLCHYNYVNIHFAIIFDIYMCVCVVVFSNLRYGCKRENMLESWIGQLSIFSSPEHKVLRVSYCDRPLSVVRRRASSVVRRPSCVVRRP